MRIASFIALIYLPASLVSVGRLQTRWWIPHADETFLVNLQ